MTHPTTPNDRTGPRGNALSAFDGLQDTWKFRASLVVFAMGTAAWSVDPTFKDDVVMGNTGSGGQGQTTMLDVDLDGDLDWMMGTKGAPYFFEFKGKDASPMWEMHKVGSGAGCETSGKAFDITGDGYPEQISGAVWFENPGEGGDITGEWTKHDNNDMAGGCADAALGDWNHDGRLDFARVDGPSAWYTIPEDPGVGPWPEHVFTGAPRIHSGLAAGDLNGDGWLDAIVAKSVMLSKSADGTQWENAGELPVGASSCLVEIGDLDADGDMDVIHQTHWGGSDNVWVENVDGSGTNWESHKVGKCHKGHSANIGDYDNDGDLDFQLGNDGGDSHIYLNEGNGTFREIVYSSTYAHDLRFGDVDQDGDLDAVGKKWGSSPHAYIENLLVDNDGPAIDSVLRWRSAMGSHNPMNPNRPKKEGCMDPSAENFDFWALHDGPITQDCIVGISTLRSEPASARETWNLSFLNGEWEPRRPTYRVNGSRLVSMVPRPAQTGMVILNKRPVKGANQGR